MFFIFIFKDVFTVILLNTITMILIVKKRKIEKLQKNPTYSVGIDTYWNSRAK